MDVDSGIENMEVEETDRKEFEPADCNRVSSSNEGSAEQVLVTIGRVLCVSWNEQIEGTISLSSNVVTGSENENPDYQDLISQSMMEVLCQFANGDNPFQGLLISTSGAPDDSPNSPDIPSIPLNLLPQSSNYQENSLKQTDGLSYLMNCYARVAQEERNHPKVSLHLQLFVILYVNYNLYIIFSII